MRMIKEEIFAGHPYVTLSPLDLALLALVSFAHAPLALTQIALTPLHLPLPHLPLPCSAKMAKHKLKWQNAS